jgi:hypothetical protein
VDRRAPRSKTFVASSVWVALPTQVTRAALVDVPNLVCGACPLKNNQTTHKTRYAAAVDAWATLQRLQVRASFYDLTPSEGARVTCAGGEQGPRVWKSHSTMHDDILRQMRAAGCHGYQTVNGGSSVSTMEHP